MQSVQLSIPKPCHQNWDKMTPTEQGRFCDACAKQVVDFTTMSDGEVLNFFLKNKEENVCGRTLPQQLDRVLEAPKPITPSKLWYWKYAAAGLLFFSKANGLQAQSVTPYTPQQINTIQNGLVGKVGEIAVINNKIVSGRITDKDGNAIPFPSIKIKGTPYGVSGDADGRYSIKLKNDNDVLQISAMGYELNELNLRNSNSYDIVLQKSKNTLKGEIVVVGTLGRISYQPKPKKHMAIIKVKDAETHTTINDATLYVKEEDDLAYDTVRLNNGTYKIKNIEEYDEYTIQASKEGFESKAIVISENNFNKRKGVFEIELKKKEVTQSVNIRGEVKIRNGAVTSISTNHQPLCVLDGKIVANETLSTLNPNDIQDLSVLKDAQATALYGINGANGVIVITTKKVKQCKVDSITKLQYRTMKEVVVNSTNCKLNRRKIVMGAVTSVTTGEIMQTVKTTLTKTDTLKQKILNLFSPIKIYPNPAQKGQPINISFSNKCNSYAIQVVSVSGVVVLNQRRQNGFTEAGAFSKKITEQIIINPQWSSGYYLINILNEQGKVIAKDGFLVL